MQDPHAHASRADITAYPLEFSGSGGEYFRVWIVNLLLSIVTLGFYTPLARRRTAQYFYGHTLVAGSPLEFTAQTKRMLIGFVLFVALYAALKVASQTGQDTVVAVMLLGGAALAPYFWASAMRFRFNATRWRGVRLQFTASWAEVYRASLPAFFFAIVWVGGLAQIGMLLEPGQDRSLPMVIGVAVAAVVISVLCAIRLEYNYKSLMVARGRIGGQPGRWKPQFGDFVRIWAATLAVFLGVVLLVAAIIAATLGGSFALLKNMKGGGIAAVLMMVAMFVAFTFLLFLASAPARAYREARMFQLVWNNIGVSKVARFKCRLRPWRYVGLRVKNVFLSLLTLGFYRPFARVSEYRMKAESVTLHVKGGLDQLAGQLAREELAVGDAIADAVGLELVG
nr:YjgN family protein [Ramlibacter cellulosilyticus]